MPFPHIHMNLLLEQPHFDMSCPTKAYWKLVSVSPAQAVCSYICQKMFGNSAISDRLLNTLSDICHTSRPISLDVFSVKQFFCCNEKSLEFLSGGSPELSVWWRMHVFVHAVSFVLVVTVLLRSS